MKKILLMLALMLPCLGAWAQVEKPKTSPAPVNGEWNADTQWFVITNGQGYVLSKDIADGEGNLKLTDMTVANATEALLWCIVGDDTNGYKFYNKASGTEQVLGLTKAAEQNARAKFVADGESEYTTAFDIASSAKTGATYWCLKEKDTDNNCWNNRSGYLAYWNHANTLKGDNGSAFLFTAVSLSDMKEYTYQVTDDKGNVYKCDNTLIEGISWTNPENITHPGLTINSRGWNENIYAAEVTFLFPVSNASTKNQVTISPFQNTSLKYYVTGSDVKTTNSVSVTNHLWEIYPSFTNGEFEFQIKNVATGKYISTSLESNTNPNQGNVTVTESEGTYFTLDSNNQFKVKGKNVYLSTHSSSSSDQYATVWGSHDGTKNTITLVNTINLVTYNLTDTDGNTYTTSVEGEKGVDPVFTGIEGYTLSNQSWSGNTFTATIDFNLPTHFAVSSETTTNLITIGQGTWSNQDAYAKLWTVVDGNVQVVNGTPTLGTAQWMVYPTLNGTKIGFKIKSASTGKFVTANLESGNDEKANNIPVTLTDEGTEFSYISTTCGSDKGFAYTNKSGTTMYLTRNGVNDNNALLGVYQASDSHHGSGLRFPEFNQYKVVIGDAGYTTVYSPFTALTNDSQYNPENYTNGNFVEIYTIAAQEVVNDKVQLTQMSYYIPAGSAAILKGNKGTYVFTQSNDDEEDYNAETQTLWAQNVLKGSSVNTIVEGEAYVLGNKSMGVALYLAELDMNENGEIVENDGTHFLNNAGKAYLPADAIDMRIQALSFNFGGTTAIESVLNSTDANAPIYDLTGRRVMNTVKGGIYIQNGKKFIVK